MNFATREKAFGIRVESDLHSAAMKAAEPYGVSALVRALLKAYVAGEITLEPTKLKREKMGTRRGRRGKRKKR